MTGERLGQAGWLSPSATGLKSTGGEAGFTSSSDDVRASLVYAKKELSGQERLRSRSASVQVVQAGFEPGRIAVTQRVCGCYCGSARANGSGGLREEVRRKKDAERRDKVSVCTGKGTRPRQDP